MHELSYLIRLAKIASDAAEANHAKTVSEVSISIGEMTGLVPDYMVRYWPSASRGTVLEGSKLTVEEIPVEFHCAGCGTSYHPSRENGYLCPICHTSAGKLIHGREFLVRSVTIEE